MLLLLLRPSPPPLRLLLLNNNSKERQQVISTIKIINLPTKTTETTTINKAYANTQKKTNSIELNQRTNESGETRRRNSKIKHRQQIIQNKQISAATQINI